jgi:hypothetical protein
MERNLTSVNSRDILTCCCHLQISPRENYTDRATASCRRS